MKKVIYATLTILFGASSVVGILAIFDPLSKESQPNNIAAALVLIALTIFFFHKLKALQTVQIPNKNEAKPPKFSRKKRMQYEQQQRQTALKTRIDEVASATELPIVQNFMVAVILKPGETCHYQAPANTIVIKNQVVGYKGGSSGVSVRVAKGVTLRSGSSRGTPIREDVVTRYPGVFTMTNQRFVMTGEKGFDRQIEKLTAMSPWNGYEGIMLQFGSSSYIVEMDEPYWVPKILDLLNESKAK